MPKRVLLIRLSSLGDCVLATSALEALRKELPELKVDFLTKRGFAPVFEDHPSVGEAIVWEEDLSPFRMAGIVKDRRYDLIVDLHRNLRTMVLRKLVGGPEWSVYEKGALRRRLAVKLRKPELLGDVHVIDRYIKALAPLGVTARRRLPKLYPGEESLRIAGQMLREAGWDGEKKVVAFAPGARWATKGWPAGKWKALIAELTEDSDIFPLMIGGPDEALLCDEVLESVDSEGANCAGKTSIMETAALLSLAMALTTNDSAPLHISSAVGTPVVAIFGPTVKGFGFYPIGPRDRVVEEDVACRPCSLHGGDECPKGHFRCMEEISSSRVADVVRELVYKR